VIGGWVAIIGGIALVVVAATQKLFDWPSWVLWVGAGAAFVAWLLLAPLMPRLLGPFFAFGEFFLLGAAIISFAFGQWQHALPLAVALVPFDMGRRSAAAAMDARAAAGGGDPAWPS
jgi:hypothetical protein